MKLNPTQEPQNLFDRWFGERSLKTSNQDHEDRNSPWHIFSLGSRTEVSNDSETIVVKSEAHNLGVKFTFVIFF